MFDMKYFGVPAIPLSWELAQHRRSVNKIKNYASLCLLFLLVDVDDRFAGPAQPGPSANSTHTRVKQLCQL
jgi:hypothetical protein